MEQPASPNTAIAPIVREAGIGPSHLVVGTKHTYKLLATENPGALAVWELDLPPGAGVPPHAHAREEEGFYVVEGNVMMEIAGSALPRHLGAGSLVFAPRGTQHAFHNAGPSHAKLLVFALPGEGIVSMFREMDRAARLADGMPPMDKIADIAGRHGVDISITV